MHRLQKGLAVFFLVFAPAVPLSAQESEPPAQFLFRDHFYLSPTEKARHNTFPVSGFLLTEQPAPEWNSNVAVVSDFAPQARALRTQILRDIRTEEEAWAWIKKQKRELSFEGVTVTELSFSLQDGTIQQRYWVGNRSFASFDQAAAEIAMLQSVIEVQGGDFKKAVALAERAVEPEKRERPVEIKSPAQFKHEEELFLRWTDQLAIGEKLWGPFHGVPPGETVLWQSFGESTWRSTNLGERSFRSVVGFWTNRLIFKGIRAPLSTVDPFVEITVAPEATGNDGGSQLDTVVGLEWRPLVRNRFLENFMPWGLPLLKFAKNYRFVLEYYDRRNLKDEIASIHDFDVRYGVDIFYEWGVDLNPLDQGKGKGFSNFLLDNTWGEYFGDYTWRKTNFTTEQDFDAWILDTSLTLGLKVPVMRLPPNPLNERLELMPYLRLGLIYNTELSNPADNRYFVAVGLRWMPFRDYRFANNEWLFKTKIFMEYLSIGKVQNFKQDDSRPHPDEDWRIGVAFSFRRF